MRTYSKLHLVDIRVYFDTQKNKMALVENNAQKNALIEIIEIILFVGETRLSNYINLIIENTKCISTFA